MSQIIEKQKKDKAVVLLSGGLDSSMSAFLLKDKYEIYPIFVDYFQKSKEAELACVMKQVEKYGYKKPVIFTASIYKSLNMGLSTDTQDIDDKDAYTPARNLFFAVPAMIYAKYLGAKIVIRGTISNDQENKVIRDNNEIFWNKVTDISIMAVNEEIKFISPVHNLSKKEVIEKGLKENFDFSITWSCFNIQKYIGYSTYEYKPCKICANCQERTESFKSLKKEDPLKSIIVDKCHNYKEL